MASSAVVSAIETLITDNWTHCPVRAFDEEPDAEVPTALGDFAELTFPVEPSETQISTGAPGNNVFREEGGFRFCVFAKRNGSVSVATWLSRIDTLRDALRNWRSSDGNLRIFEVPSPAINNRSDRNGYRELSIGVAYTHDIFR